MASSKDKSYPKRRTNDSALQGDLERKKVFFLVKVQKQFHPTVFLNFSRICCRSKFKKFEIFLFQNSNFILFRFGLRAHTHKHIRAHTHKHIHTISTRNNQTPYSAYFRRSLFCSVAKKNKIQKIKILVLLLYFKKGEK